MVIINFYFGDFGKGMNQIPSRKSDANCDIVNDNSMQFLENTLMFCYQNVTETFFCSVYTTDHYAPINCNPKYPQVQDLQGGYIGEFSNKMALRCGAFATTKIIFFPRVLIGDGFILVCR